MGGDSRARSILTQWFKRHSRTVELNVAAWSLGLLIIAMRFALFGETITWQVTLILAPIGEDALKLGTTLLFLLVLSSPINPRRPSRKRDSILHGRNALVFLPLVAGCGFALAEPLAVNRFLAHMASVGLAFAVCLQAWRRWKPLGGLALGLTVGAGVHSFLNTAYYWPLSPKGGYQFAAAYVLLTLAVLILWRASRREPASDVASEFFPRGTEMVPPG